MATNDQVSNISREEELKDSDELQKDVESPEQEAEWEGGKRRYELRKERHREGF